MYAALAQTYGMAGMRIEASEILDCLTCRAAQEYVAPYFLAGIHVGIMSTDSGRSTSLEQSGATALADDGGGRTGTPALCRREPGQSSSPAVHPRRLQTSAILPNYRGDLYELAKILGPANIKITERYSKLAKSHIAKTGSTAREIWILMEAEAREPHSERLECSLICTSKLSRRFC